MSMVLEPAVSALLEEYERRAKDEWKLMGTLSTEQIGARLDDFLLCVGPETGHLLHLLATSLKASCIVEIGVSYGYSTVWLADAARKTGGKVHSFELSSKKVEFAHGKLRSVGLDSYVEFHVGDAVQTLNELRGPVDLALIDLWKTLYRPCFDRVHPKLATEGVIVADNMLEPEMTRPDALAYQQHVRSQGDMDSVLLPIGSGIELSRKRGPQRRA
jgi:predicted O-methyltransferase YrrM